METNKVKEGQHFYKGQDITRMQVWEMIDALVELVEYRKMMECGDERLSVVYRYIFDVWNKLGIVTHRKLTRDIRSAIDSAMKDYSQEEIAQAIRNYAEILHGSQYYWSYKWTMAEFLSRRKGNNIERFLDIEVARENYKVKVNGAKETRGVRQPGEYTHPDDL